MGTKDWRILVYVSAADDDPDPEGTTVDFTITSAHLIEAPRIGGQRIRPLSGPAGRPIPEGRDGRHAPWVLAGGRDARGRRPGAVRDPGAGADILAEGPGDLGPAVSRGG